MKRVTKDFETRSECDLKKCGAYKYSLDPTTQPTCLAFKIMGDPVVYFLDFHAINKPWSGQPAKLQRLWLHLIYEGYEFSAHNSFFERCIYDNILVKRYGWPAIPPNQRRCTAAKAAAVALPRNLSGAGEALRLHAQKYGPGYSAMMATCKPTKKWKAWKTLQEKLANGKITKRQLKAAHKPEPPKFLEPDADPAVWQTLYKYCKIDVRSEEELDLSIPDLVPQEQEIWHLNQTLNWRGLRIDLPTVRKIATIMAEERFELLGELDTLTMGLVTKPGSIKKILEFLALEGVELPNLRAKTIEDALKEVDGDMKRLLEIRQALSKASTKKYQAMEDRANLDQRVRDIILYHGATTGRDSGAGIQPHNFPRGLLKVDKSRPYEAVENVVKYNREMLQLLYGESLGILFSAILRNMIVPSEGHELFVADFSKIEVAVCWWLANNDPGLRILREGKDPYKIMAARNTGRRYFEIADEGDDRQLGKAQILGCQFGMGWRKFQSSAWDMYRLKLGNKESRSAVKMYRETFPDVPALWKKYERAAISVVKEGGIIHAGKCKFIFDKSKWYGGIKILWVELPSGRRLSYPAPQIVWRVREFEKIEEVETKSGKIIEKITIETTPPMETLEFWSTGKNKKWILERTWGGTLCENITQAVARDLMMPAMLRAEKSGYKALLSVHDEGICEKKIDEGTIEEFTEILCEKPKWGEGLPIEAKGWRGPRYRK